MMYYQRRREINYSFTITFCCAYGHKLNMLCMPFIKELITQSRLRKHFHLIPSCCRCGPRKVVWIGYVRLSPGIRQLPTSFNAEVTSFSVAVAVEKQWRFFVDNLMLNIFFFFFFFWPWGWLEHLVETSASCTLSIKLSTKNLRCFSKASMLWSTATQIEHHAANLTANAPGMARGSIQHVHVALLFIALAAIWYWLRAMS